MNINILKKPWFENDSYLLEIKEFSLSTSKINELINQDSYLELKYKKFQDQDISKKGFESFLEKRGSLRFFDNLDKLYGSIYTYSVEDRNSLSYLDSLEYVKNILNKNPDSRRAVLRMANNIREYKKAEFGAYDVSCLNIIHYLNRQVNLVFRSSDIEYELYYDIITLYWFFMKPIYGNKKINIQIYGSTGQKINYLNNLIDKIYEVSK